MKFFFDWSKSDRAVTCVLRTATRGIVFLSLLMTALVVTAQISRGSPQKTAFQTCGASDLNFDDNTDVNAVEDFKAGIADLLQSEKFDELDCLADALRSNKTKFTSGAWKLHSIYSGVDHPLRHATEKDWKEDLGRLRRWTEIKPHSITARIALARAYINYAWAARGQGFADSVSDSGWQLFNKRVDKAYQILNGAAKLKSKCPEWYVAVQQVEQAQGWDAPRATALFEEAIAFEPTYYLYYRDHADQLLPKWQGEEGDTEKFATAIADRIGGKEGDIVYFEIALELVCSGGNNPEFDHMSWPRVQRGFAELEKEYGPSLVNMNRLALMAINKQDYEVADATFKRIGDNWEKEVWNEKQYFDGNKATAAQMGPLDIRSGVIREAAESNMKTSPGLEYRKTVEQKLVDYVRNCVLPGDTNREKFEIFVQVGKQGVVDDAWSQHPTKIAICVIQSLAKTHFKEEAVFPPPPQPAYWLQLNMDPAIFAVAVKQ